MKAERLAFLASKLFEASETGVAIEGLRALEPDINMDEAYQIQLLNIQKRIQAGARISGKKIGLTSRAMQEMMKVNQPDFGYLLDTMEVKDTISMQQILQPKVEAEVAFLLKRDLTGPGITPTDVLLATDCVMASLEIVGSRIADWKIDINETVADNASSGLYVLSGNRVSIDSLDLKQIGMSLWRNGKLVNTGVGAAALGHPAYCVAWLANKMGEYGVVLKKGEIVLSGALSAAAEAKPGDRFTAQFSKLGDVSVSFTE